jgi:hypothetical protein
MFVCHCALPLIPSGFFSHNKEIDCYIMADSMNKLVAIKSYITTQFTVQVNKLCPCPCIHPFILEVFVSTGFHKNLYYAFTIHHSTDQIDHQVKIWSALQRKTSNATGHQGVAKNDPHRTRMNDGYPLHQHSDEGVFSLYGTLYSFKWRTIRILCKFANSDSKIRPSTVFSPVNSLTTGQIK